MGWCSWWKVKIYLADVDRCFNCCRGSVTQHLLLFLKHLLICSETFIWRQWHSCVWWWFCTNLWVLQLELRSVVVMNLWHYSTLKMICLMVPDVIFFAPIIPGEINAVSLFIIIAFHQIIVVGSTVIILAKVKLYITS